MPDNENPQLGLTPAVTPPAVTATPPPAPTEPVAVAPAPTIATAAEVTDDAVESWMAEHPEVPVAETPAEAVETAPSTVTPPPVKAGETPAPTTEATPPGETPAIDNGAGGPIAAEAPVATTPATTPEPAKPTYAEDEPFALAANLDGTPNTWTRKQIVEAVKDAHAFRPKAAAADEFQRIFGMDADRAKAEWEPVLQRLGSEPDTSALIESVFSADPDKREYLARADAHYEAERAAGNLPAPTHPAQPVQPTAPQSGVEADLRRELADFRKYRDQQGLAAATQLFNQQYSAAIGKYPFLATDAGLRNELLQTASVLNKMDELAGVPEERRRGLPDAVAAKASIYDALLTARAAQQPAPAIVPAVEVPATLGTGGAAATTRPVDDGRPRIFKKGEDPTEEWLRTHPE